MKITFDTDEEVLPGYARVSSILKPLANFAGVDEDVLEAAKIRGQEVHKALEMDSMDIFYPVPAECRGYIDSAKRWMKLTQYQVLQSEVRLYDHSLKITGKPDAFVCVGNGPLFLVDWKNTASQNREYWEHQGMFYHHLAAKNGVNLSKKMMFVQLCPEGSMPRVYSFQATEILWRECLKYYNAYCSKNPVF